MNESDIWQSDYNWIRKEMGPSITKRRIRKLSFKHDGKVMIAEVGKQSPYDGQAVIRAIYEADAGRCFLLCGGTITIAPKDSLVEEY